MPDLLHSLCCCEWLSVLTGVGWSWNDVVVAECETNVVESCQETDQAVGYALWAVVVLLAQEMLTFLAYHKYIEYTHLSLRIQKVSLISRRETER